MIWNNNPKGTSDRLADPDTKTQPMLMAHGMVTEPIYILRSNPVSLVEVYGQVKPVYSVLTDHRNRPVEHSMIESLKDTYVHDMGQPLGIPEPEHAPFQRTQQFQIANTSLNALKRGLASVGSFIYPQVETGGKAY